MCLPCSAVMAPVPLQVSFTRSAPSDPASIDFLPPASFSVTLRNQDQMLTPVRPLYDIIFLGTSTMISVATPTDCLEEVSFAVSVDDPACALVSPSILLFGVSAVPATQSYTLTLATSCQFDRLEILYTKLGSSAQFIPPFDLNLAVAPQR
jgi:hypothetical protein